MRSKLQKTTLWLRRHDPTPTPVIVKEVRHMPGDHGEITIGNGRALIRIASSTESLMAETLIEEYCHLLRHDTPMPIDDDHDAIFWAIMGHVTKHWRGE